MQAKSLPSSASTGFWAKLTQAGIIEVSGKDAASFLHAQLTNDVLSFDDQHARLNGYCSAKGRLIANFIHWRRGSHHYLMCAEDVLESVRKRLSMFVLRADVKLAVVNMGWSVVGLGGTRARAHLHAVFGTVPEEIWQKTDNETGALIRMPDAEGLPRWMWLIPVSHAAAQIASLPLNNIQEATWRWLNIRSGIPLIVAATQERFVPQMVNWEALGGVSFSKGCYPGQEVVARSQYLGKLKRRTLLAHLEGDALPLPGSDVLGANGEVVGTVVNAERAGNGGVDLLAEMTLAESGGPLHIAFETAALWPMLKLLDLPYVLPDNEVFVRPKL